MGTTPPKILAVTISSSPEKWHVNEVPFHCYIKGWKPFGREKTKGRVTYLADRRNRAVFEALSLFPQTRHILMIDSYYLHQGDEVTRLIEEYRETISSPEYGAGILGASTWVLDKTRVRGRIRFWDSWTTPEVARLEYSPSLTGWKSVGAVGACYIYPREVWERVGYGVPEDLHGCEHNYLCENSGLPTHLSFNVKLWREPVIYPWGKRIRCSLHLGRFLGR